MQVGRAADFRCADHERRKGAEKSGRTPGHVWEASEVGSQEQRMPRLLFRCVVRVRLR